MSAVLLFSGGIESTAIAYWKRPEFLLHIDYGHRPAMGELRAARAIAKRTNLSLKEVRVDCSAIGSGELAGCAPKSCAPASSWWPFRNQLLITFGATVALDLCADILYFGSVATDRLYADNSPQFLDTLRRLIALQEGNLSLEGPAINLTTRQLVHESRIPYSLLAWTHSCHVSNWACGQCRGCLHHYRIMQEGRP
jgi:7-cyano-7-deazaguanine synthase